MRVLVALKCSKCGNKNYYTTKNKDKRAKLELRKYCPKCNSHTIHNETKA
ncbi:50S ribosomal protein L33 [Thermotoga sp. SG1]|nr:50S ribosomal protein L33 [Thermotoga sp. SG1]PLV56590.1 50S ribosomal protein L33 [Thermotoga sp. SG1]